MRARYSRLVLSVRGYYVILLIFTATYRNLDTALPRIGVGRPNDPQSGEHVETCWSQNHTMHGPSPRESTRALSSRGIGSVYALTEHSLPGY